jgi:hypothetical protein
MIRRRTCRRSNSQISKLIQVGTSGNLFLLRSQSLHLVRSRVQRSRSLQKHANLQFRPLSPNHLRGSSYAASSAVVARQSRASGARCASSTLSTFMTHTRMPGRGVGRRRGPVFGRTASAASDAAAAAVSRQAALIQRMLQTWSHTSVACISKGCYSVLI